MDYIITQYGNIGTYFRWLTYDITILCVFRDNTTIVLYSYTANYNKKKSKSTKSVYEYLSTYTRMIQ